MTFEEKIKAIDEVRRKYNIPLINTFSGSNNASINLSTISDGVVTSVSLIAKGVGIYIALSSDRTSIVAFTGSYTFKAVLYYS